MKALSILLLATMAISWIPALAYAAIIEDPDRGFIEDPDIGTIRPLPSGEDLETTVTVTHYDSTLISLNNGRCITTEQCLKIIGSAYFRATDAVNSILGRLWGVHVSRGTSVIKVSWGSDRRIRLNVTQREVNVTGGTPIAQRNARMFEALLGNVLEQRICEATRHACVSAVSKILVPGSWNLSRFPAVLPGTIVERHDGWTRLRSPDLRAEIDVDHSTGQTETYLDGMGGAETEDPVPPEEFDRFKGVYLPVFIANMALALAVGIVAGTPAALIVATIGLLNIALFLPSDIAPPPPPPGNRPPIPGDFPPNCPIRETGYWTFSGNPPKPFWNHLQYYVIPYECAPWPAGQGTGGGGG